MPLEPWTPRMTPGAWKKVQTAGDLGAARVVTVDGLQTICTCSPGNADVIAAVPDLLALARQVSSLYPPEDNNPDDPSRGLAKLARVVLRIAKEWP